MLYFDSDYMAGAHPRVLDALVKTNMMMTPGYGADIFTQRAKTAIREFCGLQEADVYFMVGGTQTNATVIDAFLRKQEGVICADAGHINQHESGAIESNGHKVMALPDHEGKISAAQIDNYIEQFYGDDTWPHRVIPGLVYITHPTEYGTLYSLSELEAISAACHKANIPLYLDGARLGYGLTANTDVTINDIARLCDAFYIGGTKCGALFGEAVVTRPGLFRNFFTLVKQHGAVLAKGRLLGLQFLTLMTDSLYLKICSKAVELALRLRQGFEEAGYPVAVDSVTNQQFFTLPNAVIDRLMQHASFEYWGPRGAESSTVRLVTSWATEPEHVEALLALLK